jgi:DNA polymerase II small subunit
MDGKKNIIDTLFEKGVLVSQDFIEKEVDESLMEKVKVENDLIVLTTDYADVIKQQTTLVDWYEMDQYRVDSERDRNDDLYQHQLQRLKSSSLQTSSNQGRLSTQEVSSLEVNLATSEKITASFSSSEEVVVPAIPSIPDDQISFLSPPVEIVISHAALAHKYATKDFANFFNSRYQFLSGILRNHQQLNNATAISRVLEKKEKEKVSVIGLVEEVGTTKNGNIIITLEDNTGRIKILASKNKGDLFSNANDLVHDEVIGVTGTSNDQIIFAEEIVWPDIPSNLELKKGPKEEYVIFLSDIHVGSSLFLKDEFAKFLSWIRGETGNETQRNIAEKVSYIIIAGDIVDGIGVYPSQESELEIKDIFGQYEEFCRLIKKIPQNKQIVICAGNHDVVHIAEPQPIIYKEYCPELHAMPNVTLVSNPGLVTIGKTKDFPGFDVLLYHGSSFDYYVANVESIRNGGGYHRADLIMKFLLKRRHLAPAFKSVPYYPAHIDDPLLIKKIPDFLVTGHIHYSNVANYKHITTISGSCWQAKTSFQEKLGHEPEPARVPIVNLKTRKVKILRFQ